jgi:hypothetical protein
MKISLGRRGIVVAAVCTLTAAGLVGVAGAAGSAGSAGSARSVGSVGADLPAPRSTATVTVNRHPDPTPLLLNVRVGRHAAYDRVVLDISGPAPGYRVGYVRRLVYDGSGAPVPLAGKAFLEIAATPAMAHTGDTGLNVFCCARLFKPNLPTVKGVALTGDFEGVVSVGLALDRRAGFRVLTLSNPTRIVVDVAH